ncbi:MAG: hypothetical protein JNK82_09240 [Myxococcaceae bacterium]|nr:hypothetical protein [Myxococcaceae bacterium]
MEIAESAPPPETRTSTTQQWQSVLSLDCAVPVEIIRPLIPGRLTIDADAGEAHVFATRLSKHPRAIFTPRIDVEVHAPLPVGPGRWANPKGSR